MMPHRLISFGIIIFLSVSPIAAQDGAPQSSDQRLSKQQLERRALRLLDEVIDDARALRLNENRLLVLARAADLLWEHDRKRAGDLFTEAMMCCGRGTDLTVSQDSHSQSSEDNQFMLRRRVLMMIARRDARLALDLLLATRPPATWAGPSGQRLIRELDMEMSLAAEAGINDSSLMLKMAEESLATGYSNEVSRLLLRLKQSDAEAALRLTRAVVTKLKMEKLSANPQAMIFALNFLRFAGVPADSDDSGPRQRTAQQAADVQPIRELIDLIANASAVVTPGSESMPALRSAMAVVEAYAPARAALLRRRLSELGRTSNAAARSWDEMRDLQRSGSTDDILAAASRAPEELRPAFYQQAALKAFSQNEVGRARQIINDNVADSTVRNGMLSMINRFNSGRLAAQGRMEEARQDIEQQTTPDTQRAEDFAQLAGVAAAQGDQAAALEFLDEARSLLSGGEKGAAHYAAQIRIARAYGAAGSARSFEMMETLITDFNELLAAAPVVDNYLPTGRSFKQGELILHGNTIVGGLCQQLSDNLRALGSADFERAKDVADLLQHSEARIMAHLSVAEGALSER